MSGLPVGADILKEEYLKLQDVVESFDQRALQIKGWSVTVSLAGMAAALIAKDVTPDLKAIAFAVSALAAIAFWIIEFSWKRFQWSFYPRIREIEAAFASGEAIAPLQINASFTKAINRITSRDFTRPFYPFLMFPHAIIAAVGIFLAVQFWGLQPGQQVKIFGAKLTVSAPAHP